MLSKEVRHRVETILWGCKVRTVRWVEQTAIPWVFLAHSFCWWMMCTQCTSCSCSVYIFSFIVRSNGTNFQCREAWKFYQLQNIFFWNRARLTSTSTTWSGWNHWVLVFSYLGEVHFYCSRQLFSSTLSDMWWVPPLRILKSSVSGTVFNITIHEEILLASFSNLGRLITDDDRSATQIKKWIEWPKT